MVLIQEMTYLRKGCGICNKIHECKLIETHWIVLTTSELNIFQKKIKNS